MRRVLVLILFLILSISLKSQNVIIKITRSEYSDVITDVEKYVKKCSKDFEIKYVCAAERIIIFNILSNKYCPNSLIIALELEFIDAEFFIKTEEDLIDSKCKDEIMNNYSKSE